MKVDDINPAMVRELRDLVKEFSPDGVRAAITTAALHKVLSPLPYIRTVLENKRNGTEKEKNSSEEEEPRKNVCGSADNVRLTDSEVLHLVRKFGKSGAEARIEAVSLSKASSGKQYKSDYYTILLWYSRGNRDGTPWDPEPQDSWHINEGWLESHTPGPGTTATTVAPSLRQGVAAGLASARRPWAPVTCQRCGEEFLAKIPKSRPPVSVCQKCRRAENDPHRSSPGNKKDSFGLGRAGNG